MTAPHIYDSFMFNNELDLLECRLTELEAIPNMTHVAVEANVDHQDHRKPYVLSENLERFDQWKDRLVVVRAKGLPPRTFDPDPWAREHAQREFIGKALSNADPNDILLQSDVDEIPTVLAARNVRPTGFVAFRQRLYCFAVDWLHPEPWHGTVAARVGKLMDGGPKAFGYMRDVRNTAPSIPDAGWHLSWLGGDKANLAKLGSFCHPEVADRINAGLAAGNTFLNEGRHVDGHKMRPVDVDSTWPRYIAERRCPDNWFRPR